MTPPVGVIFATTPLIVLVPVSRNHMFPSGPATNSDGPDVLDNWYVVTAGVPNTTGVGVGGGIGVGVGEGVAEGVGLGVGVGVDVTTVEDVGGVAEPPPPPPQAAKHDIVAPKIMNAVLEDFTTRAVRLH